MPDGVRHLRQAAALLAFVDGDVPSRDVLAKAIREVWLASADSARMAAGHRNAVGRLVTLAFRDGGINETAHGLSDDEARDIMSLIRELAAQAE